jgi:hypothetical protein
MSGHYTDYDILYSSRLINIYFTFMLPYVVTDFFLITNQTHHLSKFILS